MSKYLIAIPLFFLAAICRGQETEELFTDHDRESFFVLVSDNQVRHGDYTRRTYDGKIDVRGHYSFNKKDSVWSFYNYDGTVEQEYDYTNNKLIYYSLNDSLKNKKYKVRSGDTWSEAVLDRPVLYIGGRGTIAYFLARHIRYPAKARYKNIQGRIEVAVIIHKDGTVGSKTVLTGLSYGCTEEVLRVLDLLPPDWIPAELNGVKVDSEYIIPVNFRIK